MNCWIDVPIPQGNPVPAHPGDRIAHPARHLHREREPDLRSGARRLGKGNGDPSLVLFDEKVAPNHHKLAREFVLFDNFYVNADVSADGHNWSTAAIAPDYVQKMWPNSYAGRRKHYDYEGGEAAALPPAGYLWTNAAAAGLSMRNYGWWVDEYAEARGRAAADRGRARSGAGEVHELELSRLRPGLPGRRPREGLPGRLAAVREERDDAAADVRAPGQRSHVGYGGRQDRSAVGDGR